MMKKLLCVLLTILCLSGCTNTAQPTPTPAATTSPTPVATATPEPTATPAPTPAPKTYENIVFDDGKRLQLISQVRPDVVPKPGTFSIEERLQAAMDTYEGQQKYYWVCIEVDWEYGSPVLLTAEEILQLQDPKSQVGVILCEPARPEGYPETIHEALAYVVENEGQENYRVGVFLKGTATDSDLREMPDGKWKDSGRGFYNHRYYRELDSVDYNDNESIQQQMYAVAETFGIVEMAAMKKNEDAVAYLNEKLDGVLARHKIAPDYRNAMARLHGDYKRRQEFPTEGVSGVAYFEGGFSAETIKALMMDEDVLYIDWKLEDGKLWMP